MSDRVSKELSVSAKCLSESREYFIEVYINNQYIPYSKDSLAYIKRKSFFALYVRRHVIRSKIICPTDI